MESADHPVTSGRSRYQRAHLLWVLLLTTAVLATLWLHWYIGDKLSRVTAPLAHASVDIKFQLTAFHLNLEELIQGSASVSEQRVWQYLTDTRWHLQAMLQGGTNEDGSYLPLTDPATRLVLARMVVKLDDLERLAVERLARHTGAGSTADNDFNALYDQFIDLAESVRQAIKREIARQEQQYRTVGLGLAGFVLLLGLVAWWVLDRKEAHRQVFERRNARLARIVECSVNEIYLFDATSWRLTMVNESCRDNLRYSAEELSRMTPLDLMPECSRSRWSRLLQPLLDRTQPFVLFEAVYRRQDGSRYDVSINLQYIEGEQPLFVAFMRDITQQKKVQQSLLLHDTAVRAAANTIVITDREGVIQWANPAFTLSSGYSLEEAAGRTPRILKSDLQDKAFYQNLWQTILSGRVWQGVFINRCKDGKLVHEEATITPVRDETGQISHFIAVKQDVTARVLAEQALQEAKQKADAANQAKSDFLATMSHEIRTPLNVVLGMLELLQLSGLNASQQEQVKLAMGSGKMLLYLINDILDYSKIEANQLTLDTVPFNLRTLLDTTAFNMSPLAQAKNVELTCFYPQELPVAVRGDPNRLGQVFTNLIGNAIKFTPQGGHVEFHGGLVGRTGEEMEFLFEVRDTGIGIPPAEREHIFERFVQANVSTTRQYGGTGLGLAISQRLVHLMRGTIGVDDNPFSTSGTAFYFTATLLRQTLPPEDAPITLLSGLRLLIVGSHGLQLAFLQNALHAWGVDYADVGALETAVVELEVAARRGKPYQVVIVNQCAGSRSLSTVLNAESSMARGLCFVLLIDRLEQELGQIVDLPGDTLCLKKPFTVDQLHDTLHALLHLDSGRPSPSEPAVARFSSASCRKANLLIVDDQRANLMVTVGMLSKLGCKRSRCVTATNGVEAYERFKERAYDLVFMDCQMPVMDGYQATRLIRAWEKQQNRPPVPIVAFSADVTHANQQAFIVAGMNDFLSKPVALEGFRQVLERHLAIAPADAALSSLSQGVQEMPLFSSSLPSLLKALQIAGFEEADGKQLAQGILEQWPVALDRLEQDLRAGQHDAVRATCHQLRGSVIHILFPESQRESRRLDEAVQQQDWVLVAQRLVRVRGVFESVRGVLLEWLAQDDG
ncbi:MAG: PAS domain S-box protein [Magnetococcales bacterium]|nr:PAS domain S-box protein [Magnetococcales bacterium]